MTKMFCMEATMQISKSDTVKANIWGVEQTGFVLYILHCGTAMVEFGGVTGKKYVHTSVLKKVEV